MKKRRNETTRQPIGEKQVNRRMLGIRVILPTTVPQVYDAHVRILCHFSFHFFFFFFSFPYRHLHTRAQDSYEPIFPLFRDALFPPLPWLTFFCLKVWKIIIQGEECWTVVIIFQEDHSISKIISSN